METTAGASTRSYDIFPAFSMNSPVVPPPSWPSWGDPNVNSRPRLSIIAVNSAPHATFRQENQEVFCRKRGDGPCEAAYGCFGRLYGYTIDQASSTWGGGGVGNRALEEAGATTIMGAACCLAYEHVSAKHSCSTGEDGGGLKRKTLNDSTQKQLAPKTEACL